MSASPRTSLRYQPPIWAPVWLSGSDLSPYPALSSSQSFCPPPQLSQAKCSIGSMPNGTVEKTL